MKVINNDIKERIDNYINVKREVTPYHTNRASDLGHPCLRYLYHCRLDWTRRQLTSPKMQKIYLEGYEQERSVIRLLLDLGFRIEDQGKSFAIPHFNITGRIDGIISNGDMNTGFEVKSMEHYTFDAVNSVDDFKNPKRPWLAKSLAQVTLYMAMAHKSSWLFILKNKSRLDIKLIEVDFDMDLYNSLIEKAIIINEAIDLKRPPAPIPYSSFHCEECPFNHLCDVDEVSEFDNIDVVSDPELRDIVKNYFVLKEAAERFEVVKDDLKARFSGKNVRVGEEYKILSRLVEVKPDPEPKPRKGYKYWTLKILKI